MSYICPVCDGDMEPCRPFTSSDKQLHLTRDFRVAKSSDDVFGSHAGEGDPAMVCWTCELVLPRSSCYVNHRKPVGQTAAAGDTHA